MDEKKKQEIELILAQANAVRDALRFVYDTDTGNIWRFSNYKAFMDQYNELAAQLSALSPVAARTLKVFKTDAVKGQFDTLAMQQKSYCDSVLTMFGLLIAVAEREIGAQASDLANLVNFLQSRVRPAVMRLPDKERDVQDVVEQLLIGRGMTKGVDYDREVGRVKVSSKEVVPDFIFPKLGAALEV